MAMSIAEGRSQELEVTPTNMPLTMGDNADLSHNRCGHRVVNPVAERR